MKKRSTFVLIMFAAFVANAAVETSLTKSFLEKWADPIKNSVEAIVVGVGGAWAFWLFCLRRERETALEIDLDYQSFSYRKEDGSYFVFFDVKFTNKGKVRVTAKRDIEPAYQDFGDRDEEKSQPVDRLESSGYLILRAIPPALGPGERIEWFKDSPTDTSPRPGDICADLMDLYEVYDQQDREFATDYWIEPGETSHTAASLVLKPGLYHAMATFVGARSDGEFWRRVFPIEIPKAKSPDADKPSTPPSTPK